MKYLTIFLSLTVLVLAWLLYDTTTTMKANDADKRAEYHKNRADSAFVLYDSLLALDATREALYIQSVHRGDKAIERALNAEKQLRNEIRNNRRFTDSATDSLLVLVR